uniref:hypothetical protein n=1 Tax=Lachnoclostridium phocaeense TaxID=1871021 RepID=UPI0026DDAC4E|nr:hypothetical protein [Lachnoclostridium phocaeense]
MIKKNLIKINLVLTTICMVALVISGCLSLKTYNALSRDIKEKEDNSSRIAVDRSEEDALEIVENMVVINGKLVDLRKEQVVRLRDDVEETEGLKKGEYYLVTGARSEVQGVTKKVSDITVEVEKDSQIVVVQFPADYFVDVSKPSATKIAQY